MSKLRNPRPHHLKRPLREDSQRGGSLDFFRVHSISLPDISVKQNQYDLILLGFVFLLNC